MYELSDDVKRKEFLDELFSFMQKRDVYSGFMPHTSSPSPSHLLYTLWSWRIFERGIFWGLDLRNME
ncbi:unnamed protein product [Allacma fusca]|uniref:Uncharacterized protein n=1 Tax=Allacma fusca TaxID=39272 RepID=A0A8J2J9W3_9HEXA|nr:unnamed protein product [Allacma fusca]